MEKSEPFQENRGGIWWLALIAWPASRSPFLAEAAPDSTLLAFVGADLLLFVGGSFASAYGLLSKSPWAWPVLCAHTGAAVYAGLYCVALFLISPSSWLGAVMMVPSIVVTPLLTWFLRPEPTSHGAQESLSGSSTG